MSSAFILLTLERDARLILIRASAVLAVTETDSGAVLRVADGGALPATYTVAERFEYVRQQLTGDGVRVHPDVTDEPEAPTWPRLVDPRHDMEPR